MGVLGLDQTDGALEYASECVIEPLRLPMQYSRN